MSGRAVASTMPPGAWAGTARTAAGRGGEATVGSAVARPARRSRRRVTLAAFLLFALILVAGMSLSTRFSRFLSFVTRFFTFFRRKSCCVTCV